MLTRRLNPKVRTKHHRVLNTHLRQVVETRIRILNPAENLAQTNQLAHLPSILPTRTSTLLTLRQRIPGCILKLHKVTVRTKTPHFHQLTVRRPNRQLVDIKPPRGCVKVIPRSKITQRTRTATHKLLHLRPRTLPRRNIHRMSHRRNQLHRIIR